MLRLIMATVVVFAIGAALIWIIPLPAQAQAPLNQEAWTVVFAIKQEHISKPDCRIYVHLRAASEGQAAIDAHKYLSEKFSLKAAEDMTYMEAQVKPK